MTEKINIDRIALFAQSCYLLVVTAFSLWLAYHLFTALPFESSMLTICIFAFIYTLVWAFIIGLLSVSVGYIVAILAFVLGFIIEVGYTLYKRRV